MARALPAETHTLDAATMKLLFKHLDKNKSGKLDGAEVTEMFNTVCGCRVQVRNGPASFDLETFIRWVGMADKAYPQFKVAVNITKYLKEQIATNQIPAPDPEVLNMKNCEKLFKLLDADHDGDVQGTEVQTLFRMAGIRGVSAVRACIKKFGKIDSAEEFQRVMKYLDQQYPQLDIPEKFLLLIGKVNAGGKPPKPPPKPQDDDDDDAPAAEGKKKALLVGINYLGQKSELGGCINDVRGQMAVLKAKYGYTDGDIMLLTEDQNDEEKMPTKANIQKGFKWMLDGMKAGDQIFFHYSGHGSQCPDRTGTEPDGKNECICPLDCQAGPWPEHVILDNEIYNVFVESIPDNVKCTCIFDCCHSATVADLQVTKDFSFDDQGEDQSSRWLDPPDDLAEELQSLSTRGVDEEGILEPKGTMSAAKKVWTISGCQDNQTSADATINGKRQGALTWAVLASLEDTSYKVRYEELLTLTKKKLSGKYQQIPGLSTTAEVNLSTFYMQ